MAGKVSAWAGKVSAWLKRCWIFYQSQKHRINGTLILAAGIGVLVWAGIQSSSTKPSTPELAVLLAASGVLPIWAGVTFGKTGRVDADKAKSAVRRLSTIFTSVSLLRSEVRAAIGADIEDLSTVVLRTDRALTDLALQLGDAIEDWTDVHAEALQNVVASAAEQRRRAQRVEAQIDE